MIGSQSSHKDDLNPSIIDDVIRMIWTRDACKGLDVRFFVDEDYPVLAVHRPSVVDGRWLLRPQPTLYQLLDFSDWLLGTKPFSHMLDVQIRDALMRYEIEAPLP